MLLTALLHAGLFQLMRDKGSALPGPQASPSQTGVHLRALRLSHLAPTDTELPGLAHAELDLAASPSPDLQHLRTLAVTTTASMRPDAVATDQEAGAELSLSWTRKLKINAPDAPIPDNGAHFSLRLWIELDQRGDILGLQASDPQPQTQAFVDAVAEAITRAGLTAQDPLGRAAKAQLCLTVLFQERAPVEVAIELMRPAISQPEQCLNGLAIGGH